MIEGAQAAATTTSLGINIEVKLPKGLLDSDRFDQLLAKYAPQMAAEARDYWITEAGQRLRTSRQQYIDGIQLVQADGAGFMLSLTGDLAVAVEQGGSSADNPANDSDKHFIVMNLDKEVVNPYFPVYSNPTFRKPGNLGPHPGWQGVNIIDDVINHVMDVIIPKYVQKIIEEL